MVGHTIAALRKRVGQSQEAVARAAGLSTQHLSKIERGEHVPKVDTLNKLAAVFGTTTPELLTLNLPKPRSVRRRKAAAQ